MAARPSPAQHTVAMAFVVSAVRRLAAAARLRVLGQAGISPELLAAPQARVSAVAFGTLWLAVARELDDEFFGLDSRRMKVGSFALLCHAAAGRATVGRALAQLQRGFGLMLDDVRAEVSVHGNVARLRLSNRIANLDARRFADETMLVMWLGLLCRLAGRRVPLTRAQFAYPRPAHADEYLRMFTHRLEFDAEATAIEFEAQILHSRVNLGASALKAFLREAPQSVFLKQVVPGTWAERVRRRLRRGADWPGIEAVATELAVAPATLRRRLLAEGTSWQRVKDDLRRDMAIHQLAQLGRTVSDIAASLGFDDPASLHRAFRRWTGTVPGAYRAGR